MNNWCGLKLTIIPVLTAMPRPQYVFGTMSPKPTLKNVIAISLYGQRQMKRTISIILKKVGILCFFFVWIFRKKKEINKMKGSHGLAMATTYHIELSRFACSSSWNLYNLFFFNSLVRFNLNDQQPTRGTRTKSMRKIENKRRNIHDE